MIIKKPLIFWFIVGSQHLYGEEALKEVEKHAKIMVEGLDKDHSIPYKIIFKSVMTTSDAITKLCLEANSDESCGGLITWMHTFSPAKMWITGLSQLKKPLLHLHTQFNEELPWDTIDMDFMNLNQSAHGDREYGFIGARLRIPRKVIVGYWEDPNVRSKIGSWMYSAAGYIEGYHVKVARFGDNMRDVAVTEGDKIETQIKLGWQVSYYGIGDLVERINSVSDAQINELMDKYASLYDFDESLKNAGPKRDSVKEQARIEIGLRSFLEEGNFNAFTTNFEDLHGLKQLPGLAAQDLMKDGYGFGPEGDWKIAALLHTMKIMDGGKGTSIMEDYTYNLVPGHEAILGAHMLEVCPTVAASRPRIEVHPLSIGGKADPARLVFNSITGPAVTASIIDIGGRLRLIVNEVEAIEPKPMPKLPVARILWKPQPNLQTSAEAWILSGGAHHTSFSFGVTSEQLYDWAEMVGIECIIINKDTDIISLRNELRLNDIAWKLK